MAYENEVLADSPIGYWKLDDSGSTALDSSGAGRDLVTKLNSGTITTGIGSLLANKPSGGAFLFDDAALRTTTLSTINFPDAVTLEAWISVHALPSFRRNYFGVGTLNSNVPGNTAALSLNSNGTLAGVAINNNNSSPYTISLNTTYHIVYAVSHSGGNTTRKLYVNGNLEHTFTNATASLPGATIIAAGVIDSTMDLTIDEAALYDFELSAARVLAHYNAGIAAPNIAPSNTAAPTVSGTAKVGQTLTTTDGTWTGTPTPTYAYKWQVSDDGSTAWSDISGATSSTFTLTSSQSGKYVRSHITATNSEGSATATSSATAQIVEDPAVSTPTISGTAKVGEVLTASASATAGFPSPSLSYQWQRSDDGTTWHNIHGETASTLTLVNNEAGKYIRVEATATNSEGSDTKTSTATAQVIRDLAIDVDPVISGTAAVGQVLEVTGNGTWDGFPAPTSYSYQWEVSDDGLTGWTEVIGQTSLTTTLVSTQAGKYLRVKVTADNGIDTADAYSLASDQVVQAPSLTTPTISGSTLLGSTLTANTTAEGYPAPSLNYQWKRAATAGGSYSNISGATASTYQTTSGDLDQFVKVEITATSSEGSATDLSAAFGPISEDAPQIQNEGTGAIIGAIKVIRGF